MASNKILSVTVDVYPRLIKARAKLPRVMMSEVEFMALPEYSLTVPTGARHGRRWRKNICVDFYGTYGPPVWVMGEYVAEGNGFAIRWYKWGRAMRNLFAIFGGLIVLPDEMDLKALCAEKGVTLADYVYGDGAEGGDFAVFERSDGLALAVWSCYSHDIMNPIQPSAGFYYPTVAAAVKAHVDCDARQSFGYGTVDVKYTLNGMFDIDSLLDDFIKHQHRFSVVEMLTVQEV